MMPSLEKEGAPGVEKFLNKVKSELRFVMSGMGFDKVCNIDDSALY